MTRTLYTNAHVFTADPVAGREWAEAFVVDGGFLAYVGNEQDARDAAGANAAVVDLERRLVVPGFVDAHTPTDGGYRHGPS